MMKARKSIEQARRERFAQYVRRCVGETMCQRGMVPVEIFEEIEGRSIFDMITDRLCDDRGIGNGRKDAKQRTAFVVDGFIEKDSPQKLEAHESAVAGVAVYNWLMKSPLLEQFGDEELAEFARAFYRRGDVGLRSAEVRALRFAFETHLRGHSAARPSRPGVGIV